MPDGPTAAGAASDLRPGEVEIKNLNLISGPTSGGHGVLRWCWRWDGEIVGAPSRISAGCTAHRKAIEQKNLSQAGPISTGSTMSRR